MARTLRALVRFLMMVGRNHLDEVAEEALDLEGGNKMKAFYKGFINGIKSCTIICTTITGTMGVMYGLV